MMNPLPERTVESILVPQATDRELSDRELDRVEAGSDGVSFVSVGGFGYPGFGGYGFGPGFGGFGYGRGFGARRGFFF